MNRRVLVVDDSITMRDMVSFTLEGDGFTVLQAADGIEALAVLEQRGVDVVVTDINMPELDGIELIKAIRALPDYGYIPVLCLTTETEAQTKELARKAGATAWLGKPFEPDVLIGAVRRVCL